MEIKNIDIINQSLAKAKLSKVENKAVNPDREKELRDACTGFEAIYVHKMLSAMRQSLPGNALFKQSNAENIYRSMHDQHLAEQLANSSSSIGLKEFLFEQLKGSL